MKEDLRSFMKTPSIANNKMHCLVFLMKHFQPQQTDQWQTNKSSETAFPPQDLNNDNINRNATKWGWNLTFPHP